MNWHPLSPIHFLCRDKASTFAALQQGRPVEAQTQSNSWNVIAGMTFMQPTCTSSHGLPSYPPASATLWGLCQQKSNPHKLGRVPRIGLNSSICALGNNFNGFNTEGYIDLNSALGFDYSISTSPAGYFSGDIQVEAILPKPLAPPPLSPMAIKHTVAVAQQEGALGASLRHSSKLSIPVLHGKGAAHVSIRSPGDGRAALSVELSKKGSETEETRTRLLDGMKMQALTAAEESDEDEYIKIHASRIPCIKIDLPSGRLLPFPKRADGDTSQPRCSGTVVRWSQSWTSKVQTTVGFSSTSKKTSVDVATRIWPRVQVTGGLCVEASATGPSMSHASARLLWKGKSATSSNRYSVHLESRYLHEGVLHAVKVRRRSTQVHGAVAYASLRFKPFPAHPSLKFDVYVPI